MATSARYCPFCGARLRDDGDPLADHLGDREECRQAFAAWDPTRAVRGGSLEDEKARQMRTFLMWVIIAVLLLYAFLIAMDPLLGVLASGVVYLAFRFTGRT